MNDWRKHVLFLSLAGMMVALFFSRGVLSVCIGVFVITSFLHKDVKKHLRDFFSSPVLWSMCLLFLLPTLSGLWSEDKQEWLSVLRIKLPLLVLPLAFAGPFNFSRKQWYGLAFVFIGMMVAGSIWSFFHYAENIEAVNQSYLKAKSMATPMSNDHIRFSWIVSIAALLSGWLAWRMQKENRILAIVLLLICCWLIIYLHLLAARTGLFSLYIMFSFVGIWLISRSANRWKGAVLLVLLLALPVTAYFIFPSFQNRVKYIAYDYDYFKDLEYLPGGNDANRVISIRAGWNVLNENPMKGIGAGDVYPEIRKWNKAQYPTIQERDILYPCNEWIIYGLMCGWLGVLIFSAIMLIAIFTKRTPRLVWLLLNFTAAFGFLFDIGLEVQFGVFVYSFIVLWWWKWLEPQNKIPLRGD